MINQATAGKVLIVDDERLSVDVLSRVLTRDGYEVISAPNGALALDAVGREHPDVVLMDINMPGVGGLEGCRQAQAASGNPVAARDSRHRADRCHRSH